MSYKSFVRALPLVIGGVVLLATGLLAQPVPAYSRIHAFETLRGAAIRKADDTVIAKVADLEITESGEFAWLIAEPIVPAKGAAESGRRLSCRDYSWDPKSASFRARPGGVVEVGARVASATQSLSALRDADVALRNRGGPPAPFGVVSHLWLDVMRGRLLFVGVTPKTSSGRADERLAPWEVLESRRESSRKPDGSKTGEQPPRESIQNQNRNRSDTDKQKVKAKQTQTQKQNLQQKVPLWIAPAALATAPITQAKILSDPRVQQKILEHYRAAKSEDRGR